MYCFRGSIQLPSVGLLLEFLHQPELGQPKTCNLDIKLNPSTPRGWQEPRSLGRYLLLPKKLEQGVDQDSNPSSVFKYLP